MLLLFLFSIHKSGRALALLSRFFFLPKSLKERAEKFLESFIEGLKLLRWRDGVVLFSLTLAAGLLEGFFVFLLFRALGGGVTLLTAFFGYSVQNLTYALPMPPAQIGSQEFTWFLIFSATLGVSRELAGAAVLLAHLLTGVFLYLLGNISLSLMGFHLSGVLFGAGEAHGEEKE